MNETEQVLEAMKKAGIPVNAGKLVELTGLDRKEIDKAMKQLKANGSIVSPKMCYWEPAK
jgi:biotin operon repressor